MENLDQREIELAEKIRKSCSSNGREINPPKTAMLLHQLALVYKARSPDKLSLLQSCGLLNAALARQPNNYQEIQKDLADLCSHVLKISRAAQPSADLVQISRENYEKVQQMRKYALTKVLEVDADNCGLHRKEGAYDVKKINLIQTLQLEITRQFLSVMKSISDCTISILGEAPCAYSHLGLGSLARKEVTPFSDFESIILLEDEIVGNILYPNAIEYFRWYTVIFQVVLLNFGETIIPCLAISSLNGEINQKDNWFFDAFTPRGICPDGFVSYASKNPLGRQRPTLTKFHKTELIKSISEMFNYLSTEEDLKNGYHLADMLTTTCYVSGDERICQAFQEKVINYEKLNKDFVASERLLKQLEDDLKSYEILSNLLNAHRSKNLKTKQMIYRSSTLFILYLGKVHHCQSYFSFEILDELMQREILSVQAAGNLMYAVGIAYHTRLKTYMTKNKQSELIPLSKRPDQLNADLVEMEKIVKIRDLINYFKIISCLQKTIKRGPKEKYEEDMKTVEPAVEASILFHLMQYKEALKYVENIRETMLLKKDYIKYTECTSFINKCFFSIGSYNQALEEARNELNQRLHHSSRDQVAIADCIILIAKCLSKVRRYAESAYEFQKALEIKRTLDQRNHNEEVDCIGNIGNAYFKNQNYSIALKWLIQEKVIYNDMGTLDNKFMKRKAICFTNIAGCNFKMKNFNEALQNYLVAKDIFTILSSNEIEDEEIANCWSKIGHCYFYSKKYSEALQSYQKELDILTCNQETPEKSAKVVDCNTNLAVCQEWIKKA